MSWVNVNYIIWITSIKCWSKCSDQAYLVFRRWDSRVLCILNILYRNAVACVWSCISLNLRFMSSSRTCLDVRVLTRPDTFHLFSRGDLVLWSICGVIVFHFWDHVPVSKCIFCDSTHFPMQLVVLWRIPRFLMQRQRDIGLSECTSSCLGHPWRTSYLFYWWYLNFLYVLVFLLGH